MQSKEETKSELLNGLNAFKLKTLNEKKSSLEDYIYLHNSIFKSKESNGNMEIIEEPIVILDEDVKSIDEAESDNELSRKEEDELFALGDYKLVNNTKGNNNENNPNNDNSNAFLPGFDPMLLESLGKESIPKLLNQKRYLNPLPIVTSSVKRKKIVKESIQFKFSELSTVERDKIFYANRKTISKNSPQQSKVDILNNAFLSRHGKIYQIKEKYYKVYLMFFNSLFRPFVSQNIVEEQQRIKQNETKSFNNKAKEDFWNQNDHEDKINSSHPIENKAIIDKEYLEHYGSMYKIFDMKYLKNILYSTYQSMKNDNCPIYFRTLYQKFLLSIDEVTIRNISPEIIFSIMLILANEKSIDIIQLENSDDIELFPPPNPESNTNVIVNIKSKDE